MSVSAYEVWVVGSEHRTVVNALSAGKARYSHWLFVGDCLPGLPITAMRSRRLGAPANTTGFTRTAQMRGMPAGFACGWRVRCGDSWGTVAGSDSSANFVVIFDPDAPAMAGQRCHVHPGDFAEIVAP